MVKARESGRRLTSARFPLTFPHADGTAPTEPRTKKPGLFVGRLPPDPSIV
jgi:hypothetical protein